MQIKGKMIIIGGAEDKGTPDTRDKRSSDSFSDGILKRLIDESSKREKSRIEVVTTASSVPKEIGSDYVKAFGLLNAGNVDILDIRTREEAASPEVMKRLERADVVLFTGGDQMRLTSILGGTPFMDRLLEKYNKEDFMYAGSSAGAAAASNNMMSEGRGEEAFLKGRVRITSGLGIINNVVIDTHFVKRGRIGRLFQIVVSNPRILGIGLEEDAALLITKGTVMEAIGPEMTLIVDGRSIKDTTYNDIRDGEPISIANMVVHVMACGDKYHLDGHTVKLSHVNNS